MYTAVLCWAFVQCTQDIFVYSDIGMVYSGICIDLENNLGLDSVLYIDKCTLTLYRQVYTAILYQAFY